MNDFEKSVIGLVCAVLGGLVLKAIYSASKSHDDIITLKSKVSELENNQANGIKQMEKLFDERLKRFEDKIEHMDKTIQTSSQYFRILADEIKNNNL